MTLNESRLKAHLMNVNGIEWSHPSIGGNKAGYYGYDLTTLVGNVGELDLTAWCRMTESYDTFWTVRVEMDGVQLGFDHRFNRKSEALESAPRIAELVAEVWLINT